MYYLNSVSVLRDEKIDPLFYNTTCRTKTVHPTIVILFSNFLRVCLLSYVCSLLSLSYNYVNDYYYHSLFSVFILRLINMRNVINTRNKYSYKLVLVSKSLTCFCSTCSNCINSHLFSLCQYCYSLIFSLLMTSLSNKQICTILRVPSHFLIDRFSVTST